MKDLNFFSYPSEFPRLWGKFPRNGCISAVLNKYRVHTAHADLITNRVDYFSRFQFKPTQVSRKSHRHYYSYVLLEFFLFRKDKWMDSLQKVNILFHGLLQKCQVLHNHFVDQTFLNFLFLYNFFRVLYQQVCEEIHRTTNFLL